MNLAWLVVVIVIAVTLGISTALDFYIKKMTLEGKKVPQQVITAKEASDALYSEANKLLDLTGAEKKAWAVDQLQKQKPNLTTEVAKGMIQKSYDDAHAETPTPDESSEVTTQPIGFLDNGDDSNGSSKA
ncbi:hypothetical protein [Lactobacillus sp. A27]|uniref:hypothetical protein n=1 Tax=Lactobacillus sp. A27 TaxID=2796363 RepID=UPI00191E00AA|nr:hypothetical protein [Lactobacillus sp. A27]